MDTHTKGVPPWRRHKKVLLILNRAQAFSGLLAPLNFTTPFCENRYQKMRFWQNGVGFSASFLHHSGDLEEIM